MLASTMIFGSRPFMAKHASKNVSAARVSESNHKPSLNYFSMKCVVKFLDAIDHTALAAFDFKDHFNWAERVHVVAF